MVRAGKFTSKVPILGMYIETKRSRFDVTNSTFMTITAINLFETFSVMTDIDFNFYFIALFSEN